MSFFCGTIGNSLYFIILLFVRSQDHKTEPREAIIQYNTDEATYSSGQEL